MSIKEKYAEIFAIECSQRYPVMDAFEREYGFSVPTPRLQAAAEVLACPIKANPPNWQHGRLIYAMARAYLARDHGKGLFLDIGTAKGFSACVMTWAIEDAGLSIPVVSIDVVEPFQPAQRNTVAELDGFKTVPQLADPFRAVSLSPVWLSGGASRWLKASLKPRVLLAFVDGKHSEDAVRADAAGISQRQTTGDVIIFDDCQIPGVMAAVRAVKGYEVHHLTLSPLRSYAIATKQ